MTIEQAAALRVIFKLEFVGKTGELLKKSEGQDHAAILSRIVRNTEIWSKIDNAVGASMLEAYRRQETDLTIGQNIEVLLPQGMLETIQGIIRTGEYMDTLTASKASQQSMITMGSMVHIVVIERCLEDLKRILMVVEKPDMVFFPMKAAEGKN